MRHSEPTTNDAGKTTYPRANHGAESHHRSQRRRSDQGAARAKYPRRLRQAAKTYKFEIRESKTAMR